MIIESLQLGSLTLVGERRPSAILVTVANDFGEQRFYVSKDQWSSLLALADTKLAGEREVERLKQQLSTLEKYVAHNDDEYLTMKEVLRAEHQECERLRLDNERLSTRLSAMTAARDEACDLVSDCLDRMTSLVDEHGADVTDEPGFVNAENKLATLRKAGLL